MPQWLARVLGPDGPELTCEQCFELIDRYVDLELTGDDADARYAGMKAHLVGCRACNEEHELLLEYARERPS